MENEGKRKAEQEGKKKRSQEDWTQERFFTDRTGPDPDVASSAGRSAEGA
jgi:hypothetical protein